MSRVKVVVTNDEFTEDDRLMRRIRTDSMAYFRVFMSLFP